MNAEELRTMWRELSAVREVVRLEEAPIYETLEELLTSAMGEVQGLLICSATIEDMTR